MPKKRFANVFTVPKRPNYKALEKAVDANKHMAPATKNKIKATLRRKARGY